MAGATVGGISSAAKVSSGLVGGDGSIVFGFTAGLAGEESGAVAESVFPFVTAVDLGSVIADWLQATARTSVPKRIPKCPLVNKCTSCSVLLWLRFVRFKISHVG
jgi:hypothetical protein